MILVETPGYKSLFSSWSFILATNLFLSYDDIHIFISINVGFDSGNLLIISKKLSIFKETNFSFNKLINWFLYFFSLMFIKYEFYIYDNVEVSEEVIFL